jgi:hypothetical protein
MCLHKFGNWSKPYNTTQHRNFGGFGDYHTVEVVEQSRVCRKCNKFESRIIKDGKITDYITKVT